MRALARRAVHHQRLTLGVQIPVAPAQRDRQRLQTGRGADLVRDVGGELGEGGQALAPLLALADARLQLRRGIVPQPLGRQAAERGDDLLGYGIA